MNLVWFRRCFMVWVTGPRLLWELSSTAPSWSDPGLFKEFRWQNYEKKEKKEREAARRVEGMNSSGLSWWYHAPCVWIMEKTRRADPLDPAELRRDNTAHIRRVLHVTLGRYSHSHISIFHFWDCLRRHKHIVVFLWCSSGVHETSWDL